MRTAFSFERSHFVHQVAAADLAEEYVEFNDGAVSDPTSMGADWGADCLRPWNGCGSLFVDTI